MQNSVHDFCFCWKKYFHRILLFFKLANVFFGMGVQHGCVDAFSGKEGRIQVLAGLAPSIQTIGSLLKIRWLAKPAVKICNN
jgi:hypothetical protein